MTDTSLVQELLRVQARSRQLETIEGEPTSTLPYTSITYSGLTIGTVLRATGAAAASFGAVDLANGSAVTGVLATGNIPNLAASKITSGQLALARGGTNADLSATGGTSQVLKQVSAGAAITVARLAAADLSDFVDATAWTPSYYGLTTAGVTTYTAQNGYYIRIGSAVFAWATIVWTGATGTGNVALGLPHTIASVRVSASFRSDRVTYAGTGLQALALVGNNYLSLESPNSNAVPTAVAVEAVGLLDFSVSYLI